MSRGSVRNGVYQGDGTESAFGDYAVIEENPSGSGSPIYSELVAVNASGQVAYLVQESLGYGIRITRVGPSGPVTIAQLGDAIEGAPGPIANLGPPAMNDSGRVAFVAPLSGAGQGVFIGDGDSTEMIYFLASPGEVLYQVLSINNHDEVLISGLFDGHTGLYVVRNQGLEKVVAEGDSFLGSTIYQLSASSPALNDAGQIAFGVQLLGGRKIVVRADPIVAQPVPGLSWIPAYGLAALLAALGVRRLARVD